MHKFIKMLGASFVCVFVLSAAFAAGESDVSRVSANMMRTNHANQSARMVVMPGLTTNTITNGAINTGNNSTTSNTKPDEPDVPSSKCPDGGVADSEYGIAECMNDILSCINNGALSGGLNDLFNEDMRNAIVNGMGLCSVQVDNCIVSVRRDCKPVYRTIADVWVDFNSRKIQPEYYNFILRKTGLTPNQAENTCMLLDKNTYGPSFAAVANDGKTTEEYKNTVGAYNSQQGNVLVKTNPVGAKVNDGNPGVDGVRGHYARWDATTGTCYVRVAAYNKDQQIKNSWLFGTLGDDEMAEVWRAAGDTFTCNKDLFGFSLMKNTESAAVGLIGGGTLLGAGIGAMSGHGDRKFDCSNEKHRALLMEYIDNNKRVSLVNNYLDYPIFIGSGSVSESTCGELVDLYGKITPIDNALKVCSGVKIETVETISAKITCEGGDDCFNKYAETKNCVNKGIKTVSECLKSLGYPSQTTVSGNGAACGSFKSIRKSSSDDIFCTSSNSDCVDAMTMNIDIKNLKSIFGTETDEDSLAYLIINGESSTRARNAGIGAAIGAGTGGVATAITAFVEKSNINCRVGDGLNTVAFGKSHTIDTLKDFYVKWNLRLPDTVSPTSTAVDCKSWKLACAQYTDLDQCEKVALNYRPSTKPSGTITLVQSACAVSGSVCIENAVVANSYGACK